MVAVQAERDMSTNYRHKEKSLRFSRRFLSIGKRLFRPLPVLLSYMIALFVFGKLDAQE
jgi:hypothetical protein